jgi:hypothetical protein
MLLMTKYAISATNPEIKISPITAIWAELGLSNLRAIRYENGLHGFGK